MSTTLVINAHPSYNSEDSYSKKMQDIFKQKFKLEFPTEDFDVLNLYEEIVPRIEEGGLLTVWDKQMNNLELTIEELEIAKKSESLVDQFISHHRIVIVSPLHNFNITSRLKDYIDNILIAKKTFRYTESGSEGLMINDYKVLLLQASGGIYTDNDRYTSLEFSYYYLKEMFENLMGFDNFYIVRAQGTTIQPIQSQKIIEQAEHEIKSVFENFYGKSKKR
ncbi:NAD(P)H-dependent oxidoreductase [Lactococcus lactis]|uniref:FMN-dependent NADH-azoreductase n=1 Tax=Lactococcus lactis TaxID=1358 RepID=UPI001F35372B|nr:NAD(P)H-dependent oxidoreductase [Lactococcus lactis]MCG1001720.1 NAD(P)H-dependent oxidoreductase [Lactococcus lactis]